MSVRSVEQVDLGYINITEEFKKTDEFQRVLDIIYEKICLETPNPEGDRQSAAFIEK